MTLDWRELWEQHADKEREYLDRLPVEALLENVNSGQYGDYYNIWRSIADRADIKIAGWLLFDSLKTELDYLHRYHCAEALLTLLQSNEYEPVELSSENHHYKENIGKLSKLLEAKIGPHK